MAGTSAAGLPSLPTPTILASVAGTNASPGSLLLLSFIGPDPSSPLLTLKPYVSSSKHGTAILPPNVASNTDGLVVTSEEGKNVIYIHHIPCTGLGAQGTSRSSTATSRLIAPEKVVALDLSPDGSMMVVGCPNGHAYLYALASGHLLASWEPHFRAVDVVRFSPDGACIATGGQDGRVCVWSVGSLVSGQGSTNNGPPKAYATFTSHLLSITDLHFSPGAGFAFPHAAQLWSSSEDGTLRLWDLRTRSLLTNFQFKTGATAQDKMGSVNTFIPDPSGRFCFAAVSHLQSDGKASSGGRVFRIDLHRRIGSAQTYEAIGGGGMQDVEQVGGSAQTQKKHFIEFKSTPLSLALTPSTSHLLVGTAATPTLHMVDVPSLQIVRSSNMDVTGGSQVRSLDVFYRTTSSTGSATRSEKRAVAAQLARVVSTYDVDQDEDDDEDVHWAQVPAGDDTTSEDYDLQTGPFDGAPQQPLPSLSANTTTPTQSTPLSTEQAHDLHTQLATLRSQLQQANEWNKDMWKHVVQSAANGRQQQPDENDKESNAAPNTRRSNGTSKGEQKKKRKR